MQNNNNNNKKIFLSEGKKDILDIDYIQIFSKKKERGGLSGGAIAGIVIACIAVLIVSTVLALFCVRNKKIVSDSSAVEIYNSTSNLNK